MTTTNVLTNMVLVESKKTATIHAPVERVNGDIAKEQVRLSQLHIIEPTQLARHIAGKGKDWRMVAGCLIKTGDNGCTTRTGRARA